MTPGGYSSSSSSVPPSLVDSLFQRSLDDLIKTLRSSPPAGEHLAISRALDEIRREILSSDPDTKSVALSKLTYLSSLHHIDASWAAFHALELLPSPSLPTKRLAYLAASLIFHHSTTPVLPLATHQLRKDLTSPSPILPSLALRLFSSASSPDLAAHLSSELHALLSPSRPPHVRRYALAASLPLLSLHPDSVPLALPRLVDALSDPLSSPAAVSVFCELSASDPRPYLPLAPEFFRLLSDSPRNNNWALIKILKIFARLAPLEPRLSRRILDPIVDLIRRSPATSLVFECIRTVLSSLSQHDAAVRLSVDKLRDDFLSSDDPNLRFLGLHALSMLPPLHSWAVEENRDVVIKSLDDPDPNIRREALHLVMGMVFDSNVVEISELLLKYAHRSDPEFCNEILDALLSTCGRNVYELIVDFDWYVSLLGDMSRNPYCAKGEEIERQLVDIGLRVRDARPELVRVARDLLINPALLGNPLLYRILSAAAWISGAYVELSRNPVELVEALLQPRTNLLPSLVRAVYIQSVFKVLVFCFNSYMEQVEARHFLSLDDSIYGRANSKIDEKTGLECDGDVAKSQDKNSLMGSIESKEPFKHDSFVYILNLVETSLAPLSECDQVDVQERVRNVLGLIRVLRTVQDRNIKEETGLKEDNWGSKIIKHMQDVFSHELGPVSVHAQQKVSLPEGLVLVENLADLATVLGDDVVPSASASFSLRRNHQKEAVSDATPSIGSASLLAEHRKRHGLYYLPSEKGESESSDYPPANEPLLAVTHADTSEDLKKLTEQSLIPRKSKNTKPRPVVVKLEEGEPPSTSSSKSVKEPKDDLLSGAIRDVLMGSERKPEHSQKKSSDMPPRVMVTDTLINIQSTPQSNETSNIGVQEHESSSSRSRHQSNVNDRHGRNDGKEGKSHRSSTKRGHRHGNHKHRHTEVSLDVVPQAPVIPDFLL